MKKIHLVLLLGLLGVGAVRAQSNLPACVGSDVKWWSGCQGTTAYANGNKYTGEFKDGKRNGRGTFTLADGRLWAEGIWADDKFVREERLNQPSPNNLAVQQNGAQPKFDSSWVEEPSIEVHYMRALDGAFIRNLQVQEQTVDAVINLIRGGDASLTLNREVPGVPREVRGYWRLENGEVVITLMNRWTLVGTVVSRNYRSRSNASPPPITGIFVRSTSAPSSMLGDYRQTFGNLEFDSGRHRSLASRLYRDQSNFVPHTPTPALAQSAPPAFERSATAVINRPPPDPENKSMAKPACLDSDHWSQWNDCLGTQNFASGNKYLGEYKDGSPGGRGTFTFANGDKYVGEFNAGKFHGAGTYTFANGNKNIGEWKLGKFNGRGTETFANGDKYVGNFKDGKYNGAGILTHADGRKYDGEFKDGRLNNWGILTYANGDKYGGEFKDGQPNGKGSITYANGSSYVGGFKDGKRNGQGTLTLPGGSKYVGEFQDDKPDGMGTEFSANESIRRAGLWQSGELVRNDFLIAKMCSGRPVVLTEAVESISRVARVHPSQIRLDRVEFKAEGRWSACIGVFYTQNGAFKGVISFDGLGRISGAAVN